MVKGEQMDRPDAFRGVSEPAYDRARHYTRATNDFDHSTTIRVNVPKDILAKIQYYVRLGMIPEYRSDQDLVRDAIHHQLQWIADTFGDWEAEAMLGMQAAICSVSQARVAMKERQDFFESLEQLIRDYEQAGEYTLMAVYLDQLEMQTFDLDELGRAHLDRIVGDARESVERARRRAET